LIQSLPTDKPRSRTTTKESRLVEYLNTFDAPRLTDAEIAAIDEAGAKEYHRQFVRSSSFGTVALLSADISFPNSHLSFPRKSEVLDPERKALVFEVVLSLYITSA
jgi:hypothetical protein